MSDNPMTFVDQGVEFRFWCTVNDVGDEALFRLAALDERTGQVVQLDHRLSEEAAFNLPDGYIRSEMVRRIHAKLTETPTTREDIQLQRRLALGGQAAAIAKGPTLGETADRMLMDYLLRDEAIDEAFVAAFTPEVRSSEWAAAPRKSTKRKRRHPKPLSLAECLPPLCGMGG